MKIGDEMKKFTKFVLFLIIIIFGILIYIFLNQNSFQSTTACNLELLIKTNSLVQSQETAAKSYNSHLDEFKSSVIDVNQLKNKQLISEDTFKMCSINKNS